MRDKSHDAQIERWALYVKSHPKEWKKHLTPFINAQIEIANRFYSKLAETKEGREKIKRLREVKIKQA